MRIALLNLPIDNNYGGNLQRYALIKVLQDMGHDVEHVQLKSTDKHSWTIPFRILKRTFVRIFNHNQEIFIERNRKKKIAEILPFYKQYIPHSSEEYDENNIHELCHYDAYIVGSDQVWRKKISKNNLPLLFLNFISDRNIVKLAYSVSFGCDVNELNKSEINLLGELYSRFTAVSVREFSGIDLIKSYGWELPKPIQLLDPTFLLSIDNYKCIIDNNRTSKSKGELFCYLLDPSSEKYDKVRQISSSKGFVPFFCTLNDRISIEQWLKSFYDAKYVITDSYHGMVFSIIFNKPFYLFRNEKRGNSRFDTLFNLFKIKDTENIDWKIVNGVIAYKRSCSIAFLSSNLYL